jgi:hypothetical protein
MKEVMNMTEKKMTKREYINRILTYAHDEDKAYLEHELELLDKKNSAERKPSEKQVAKTAHDAELRSAIVNEMEMNTLYSAGDLIKNLPTLSAEADLSPAKVSYLMRDLMTDGSVVKVVEKRHTFYKLAD